MHGKGVGRRSFAYFGLGVLLVLGFVWRESAGEARRGLGASRVSQAVRGPGWLLAGPELARAVAAPQRSEAERGVEAFHDGEIETAVAAFRSLALDLPGNAAIQSDLAALYLARAARPGGSPHDLVSALDAAERATHLAPRLPPARFNQAEALTRLHLPAAATAAWNRFLALAGESPRANRAQQAMASLREPSAFDGWQTEQDRFEAAALAGDEDELRELVRRYPLFARLHTEETLLPAWGRAALATDPDDAGRRLAALDRIGSAFAERTHDSMVPDTLASIERASAPRRLEIARGLAAFGEGMARYRDAGKGDPGALLQQAAKALRPDCPLGFWARLYDGVALLHRESAAAEAAYRELERAVDPIRYPVLAGRIRWLRGTAALVLDRPERAIAHYRIAFERLSASEGPQSAGYVHLLLGEAFGKIGERGEEWRERLAALPAVYRAGELRAVHATLYDSIDSLLAEGRPWAALGFSRELGAVAARRNRPTARIESALQLGRILGQLGDPEGAQQSFRAAERHLPDLGLDDLREKIRGTLEMAEGQALLATDPGAAVIHLTAALERQRGSEYRYYEAGLLSTRAAAFRSLGRLDEAEADLVAALRGFEDRRSDTRDQGLRQASFEAAQAAFDRMIALQTEDLGDPERAFVYAERSRSRLLLDQARDAGPGPLSSVAELRAGFPAGAVLVEYAILPDRLYLWTFDGARLELHVERIAARELGRLVDRFALEIELGRVSRTAPSAASALYDRLIRPVLEDLPPGADLVLVPDRFLAGVPFAALVDASRGRFLVEDRVLTLQPSATLYAGAVRRARSMRPANAGGMLLAVGDPAFDRRVHPGLPRLPEAAKEAEEIAAQHGPDTALLTGVAAGRNAFLAAAPRATVIHFAGHALFDPFSPAQSRLLLRADRPEEPGTLSAGEIAALRLPRTELVVLSACRGVGGGDPGRENLTGLAAAFLAAGVPTVVASLWNASDATTRRFMLGYYRAMAEGMPPERALREAQLELLRGKETDLAAPAAWAGFEVFGSDSDAR